MASFHPDPKPPKRYRATPGEWAHLRKLVLRNPCWICGGKPESCHHIYPRGQGGSDVLPNLAAVCGSGTTGCHGKLEAHDPAARYALGMSLSIDFIRYLAEVLGSTDQAWDWIDRQLLGKVPVAERDSAQVDKECVATRLMEATPPAAKSPLAVEQTLSPRFATGDKSGDSPSENSPSPGVAPTGSAVPGTALPLTRCR